MGIAPLAFRVAAVSVPGTLAAVCVCAPAAIAQQPTTPAASNDGPDYVAKLAATDGKPLVQTFMLCQEIAKLPPEKGWPVVRDNWDKLSVETKKQMLKAWTFKAKDNPHLRDVQNLGAKDASTEVQDLAGKLISGEAGKAPLAAKDGGAEAVPPDIADIPFQDLKAGGDENRRYFLIGPRPGAKPPAAGYRLALILPGGEGGADFRAFVQRILKNSLPDDCIVAELVAPKWARSKEYVWPTSISKTETPKILTEDFIDAVIKDVGMKLPVDSKRIDALGWSSSGPAVYASILKEKSPIRGAFVAMAVFKPDMLPPVKGAAGHRFYILHSPQDKIAMSFPEAARDQLAKAGAKTTLKTYEGGHGWHGDVFGTIKEGFEWLEKKDE
jgi:predicted esterase